MTEVLNSNTFCEMSELELESTDGGNALAIAGIVITSIGAAYIIYQAAEKVAYNLGYEAGRKDR